MPDEQIQDLTPLALDPSRSRIDPSRSRSRGAEGTAFIGAFQGIRRRIGFQTGGLSPPEPPLQVKVHDDRQVVAGDAGEGEAAALGGGEA